MFKTPVESPREAVAPIHAALGKIKARRAGDDTTLKRIMAHFNNKGSDENVFEAMYRQGSGVTFDDDGMPLIYKLQP